MNEEQYSMNSVAEDYLNDKKFLNLWAPYSALLPQVKEFTSALFDALANREEISGSMLRYVAQDILSKAILLYPVHQVEKIAYRTNETLKGIINWLEDCYPKEDLRQARIELNYFDGMTAYANKIARAHDWPTFLSLVKVMAEQRIGNKTPDAEFANQVLGSILCSGYLVKEDDTQGLDEFVATATQVADLFNPPRFNSYPMNPSLLIHALRQVGDGTYSLDRPEVSGILKAMFFSLGKPTNVMGGEQSMIRAIEAIDQHFDNDEEKIQLVSQFNRAFYARDESTNRDCLDPFYFALLIKPDKPDYLQAMLQGTFTWTWQSRAAVDACLQKKDADCTQQELIIKMINMTPKQANAWKLPYAFRPILEAPLDLSTEAIGTEDFFKMNWEHYLLEVEGSNGKMLIKLLSELLPKVAQISGVTSPSGFTTTKQPPKGPPGGTYWYTMEREALRRLQHADKQENLQAYWAALSACGETDAARKLLSNFWKGNFKGLKAWVDAFKDDMTHYERYEWVNEERLQADLGL
jgi:hypothetical protein